MYNKALLLALFMTTLAVTLADLSCMDGNNNPVPWFTFIKYPENKTYDGARYAYLDPSLGSQYKIIYGKHIDSAYEALPNTIEAINAVPDEAANVLIYNDEPPNDPWNPEGGHAKGIIAYDNRTKTGVYIMHSLPKFPNVSIDGTWINYTTPKNTWMYGQNGYCLSIDQKILGQLLHNLPVEQPNIYIARGLFSYMPLSEPGSYKIASFNALDGDSNWYLTKNPNFAGFLYEDVIGPYFHSSLAVESWGRPYQNPNCSQYSSLNINQIAFNTEDTWDHYSDHSKWALTVGDGNPEVACLCDMNRMDTQEVRGGSCLCISNPNLYKALTNIIVLTDKCGTKIDE